jgi:hypothetical protein
VKKRFLVSVTVQIHIAVFWVMAPCSLIGDSVRTNGVIQEDHITKEYFSSFFLYAFTALLTLAAFSGS